MTESGPGERDESEDDDDQQRRPTTQTSATRRQRPWSEEVGFFRWAFSLLLILPVRIYQVFISPLLGPSCRFDPTCSQYFIESVRKYGPLRGAWRGVCRIARCHPFHPGGYDPP